MRAVSALVLAIALGGCGSPYLDLRYPVYLVPKKSFWAGCDEHPLGPQVCRSGRIGQVFNGVDEWFRYFHPDHRPEVVVVLSANGVPFDAVNGPIYLAVDKNDCGKDSEACYISRWYKETEIIFMATDKISDFMAHEFGHALGRDDNDVSKGTVSAMSYDLYGTVTPQDFIMMCRMHHECRIVKRQP